MTRCPCAVSMTNTSTPASATRALSAHVAVVPAAAPVRSRPALSVARGCGLADPVETLRQRAASASVRACGVENLAWLGSRWSSHIVRHGVIAHPGEAITPGGTIRAPIDQATLEDDHRDASCARLWMSAMARRTPNRRVPASLGCRHQVSGERHRLLYRRDRRILRRRITMPPRATVSAIRRDYRGLWRHYRNGGARAVGGGPNRRQRDATPDRFG